MKLVVQAFENERYKKVGRHPCSLRFTNSQTVTEVIKLHIGISPKQLKRVFFDQGHANYLFETEGGRGVLLTMNDHNRWEISTMMLKHEAAA